MHRPLTCLFLSALVLSVIFTPVPLAADATPGTGSDWFARVTENIRDGEYEFQPTASGDYEAPNRTHGFRATVTAGALRVEPRVVDAAPWALTWRTARWGRGTALSALSYAGADVRDGQLTLDHGGVREILVNDESGLEQKFEIPVPPSPGRDAGPLVVELTLGGDLLAFQAEDGSAVGFSDAAGRPLLHLAALHVVDAGGAPLPARFDVGPGRLALVIDDGDAVYPLLVDPLLSSTSWSAESNQASAYYGFAVATAGDVNGDGYSDVLVGAYNYDNGQTDEGRVFLYLGSAGGPSATADVTWESNQAGAQFGRSLAPAGDLDNDGFDDIVIGAALYDNGQTNEGRIFVVRGASPEPAATFAATRESDQAEARFGYAVSGAGDVDGDGDTEIVVGAPLWDGGLADEGRIYVFLGSGAPTDPLDPATPFTFEPNQSGANLGISVSSAGDVNADGFNDVIAGAHQHDPSGSLVDAGRAYGFHGSATGLPATPNWTENGAQAGGLFGEKLAAAGDTNGDGYADVIVAATWYDGTLTDEGRIYVYRGSASGLAATPSETRDGGAGSVNFGRALATAGDVNGDGFADVAAVGAFPAGGVNRGEVRVFHGSPAGIAATPSWFAQGTQNNGYFGEGVATAGDVNGDGFSDLIVGQGGWTSGQSEEGRAVLYLGSGDGLSTAAQATLNQADPSGTGSQGWSVASAGDVNADGYSDVVVGAPFYRLGGGVFIFLGSVTGISTTPHREIQPGVNDARFGWSVSSAGDVNGDGYDDVVVGATHYYYDSVRDYYDGRILVYHGSATGVDGTADFAYPAAAPGAIYFDDEFGAAVASAGDTDGDGFGDVVVYNQGRLFFGSATGLVSHRSGQPTYFGTGNAVDACDVNGDGYSDIVVGERDDFDEEGRIYFGGPGGPDSTADWAVGGNGYGQAAACAGDVNRDGYADVLVAQHVFLANSDTVFGYYGGPGGPDTTADWQITGTATIESVASAGDVNGDGFSDVIVGLPGASPGGSNSGSARVYLGSASGLSTTPAWTINGTVVAGNLGKSVAAAGDVNGDAFGDVIVGESGRGDGYSYVHLGGGGDGLEFVPQNWRNDNASPLALLNRSDAADRFRVHSRGRTARGRGLVAMDSQVAPIGTALANGPKVDGSYFDTGTTDASGAAVNFNRLVSGLTADTFYRWRMRFRAKDPLFPRTRWMSLPGNAPEETDIRTRCTDLTWYRDADLDGYGASATTQLACTQPAGYVAQGGDCNDADAAMFPGNPEVCDGKDNDCAGGVDNGFVAPGGTPDVTARRSGTAIRLSWPVLVGADRFDTVRGRVKELLVSKGNFKTTEACVANDQTSTTVSDATMPVANDGIWYLVRGVNCNAGGTYDSQSPSQVGSRDAEIAASGNACP